MRINNNLMALNAHRYMSQANQKQSKSLEKLSSGLAINSAADNAAGLAISEKMRAQINGLEQATSNAQDGISMIQTAEGALQESENILQRMRELAVQSSNDTNTAEDRGEIQKEIDQLSSEISRISESTEFNTKKLLDGSLSGKLHIGANEGQDLSVSISAMDADTLGVSGDGEGKAAFEIESNHTAISGYTGSALSEGEQELNVVKVDNITVGGDSDVSANYGLADTDGNIVAVSSNGEDYTLLTEATSTNELGTATTDSNAIGFDDPVISGNVTLTTTDNSGNLDIATDGATATASVDVEGLETGTYTISDNYELADIEAVVSGTVDQTTTDQNAFDNIALVARNSNDEIVAVNFGAAGNAEADEWYAVDDDGIKWDVNDSTLGNLITTDVESIMTPTTVLEAGDELTIAASGGIDVSSQEAASAAITTLNTAINDVSAERANLGSIQNRLDHTINNLSTTAENMTASESRIRDVDMAKEMMEYTKLGILQQASQAMLAQANQAPQGVLQLLQ